LPYGPPTTRLVEVEGPTAFSLAESIGDDTRAARVAYQLAVAIFVQSNFSNPDYFKWIERLDHHAQPDTMERIYANVHLAMIKQWSEKDIKAAKKLLTQNVESAHRMGDQKALIAALQAKLRFLSIPQDNEERVSLAEELWELVRQAGIITSVQSQIMLEAAGNVFLQSGQRQQTEEVFSEWRDLARRTDNYHNIATSLGVDSVLAVLDGRLYEAIEMSDRIRAIGEETGALGFFMVWARKGGLRAQLYLGMLPEDLERWDPEYQQQAPGSEPLHCLMQAHLGWDKEASEILDSQVVNRSNFGTDEDATDTWRDAFYLEASIPTKHRKAAKLLLERMNVPGLYICSEVPTCIPRHLGGAAALLERYDEARQHYQEAIRVCTDMRFRPELALSRLQLAELLLDRYPDEKSEALEHLDFAIKEFREIKMQPSLERALRRKDILKA